VAATPEDAVRLGADAIAVAAFVRGPTEAAYLRTIADTVRQAAPFGLPVICHIYPRRFAQTVSISFDPEDIAWAVRCAAEVGADVVKSPYCGDMAAHKQIVADCPVPLVAAGGPQTHTLQEALGLMADAVSVGVLGATIGRNIWGTEKVTQTLAAFKAVIHDGKTPAEAMAVAGLKG
jgi:fructose-bisphosphate aldolase, class I